MTTPAAKLTYALIAAGLYDLAERASTGEFGDFTGPHATPKIILVGELDKIGTPEAKLVRDQVVHGDFDG